MLYIVYIIKIGPALRKNKVKSREIHDFFNFIQGNLVFFWKIAKIQGSENPAHIFIYKPSYQFHPSTGSDRY